MRRAHEQPECDPRRALVRRAARWLRRGEERKAVVALREAASLDASGASYTRLGYALMRAGKKDDALRALRQALYLFRHDEMRGRARTVARMILALDPLDATAQRRVA